MEPSARTGDARAATVATAPGPVSPADRDAVERLLGRAPMADFEVVVRDAAGAPRVIRNAPFLHDGTPMPTRYWLVDPSWAGRSPASRPPAGCATRSGPSTRRS